MRGTESVKYSGIAATTAAFGLTGGVYVLAVSATFGGGSVGVDIQLPDGTSWAPVLTALTAAGISGPLYLPPGTYRVSVATATAVLASLTRVPYE